MDDSRFIRFAGWCAYLSAAMTVLGLVTLMIFFALISQQGIGNIWGPINDATSVILALTNIVLLVALHRLYRSVASMTSLVAVIVGVAAMLVAAVMQSLLILKVIAFAATAVAVPAAFGVFGAALIVYCLLARRAAAWSKRLVWFGILAGAGYVLTIVGWIACGTQSPIIYVGGLLAVICVTVLAIGFGRMLLSAKETISR